ncbi:MAG: hypothetical protein WEC82_05720 [Xanthobacteraceae bacterium]
MRWLVADLKFDLTLRRLARKYSPDQPRVPRGDPDGGQWTDGGGGSGGTSTGTARTRVAGPGGGRTTRVGQNFPGATHGQQVRLEQAIARTETALAKIRQHDPNWRPTTESITAPRSIEGAISHAQARTIEAEARLERLRRGIGGNLGPRLEPPPRAELGATPSQVFDGPSWIGAYRATNNMPDLFEEPTWRSDQGTVAATEVNGSLVFGTNSNAPGYTTADRVQADAQRRALIEKYPDVMNRRNIGLAPNNSLYHAEATVLLRAANANNGTLENRNIEIHVDREMCSSCQDVLPYLGLEIGNPVVTFVDPNGRKRTMWGGSWLGGKDK